MRAIIHHGDNAKCPSVTVEGASHCPGHWVETETNSEQMLDQCLKEAYGRGFRKCFDLMVAGFVKENGAIRDAIRLGMFVSLGDVMRVLLLTEMGPHAASGWDSVDNPNWPESPPPETVTSK